MNVERPHEDPGLADPTVGITLHSPGYPGVLRLAAVIGIPLSLVGFGFPVAVRELERLAV